jgi:hypothetical protein
LIETWLPVRLEIVALLPAPLPALLPALLKEISRRSLLEDREESEEVN